VELTVPLDGLAAGPLLLPGLPAIPAPELWALGAPETSGFWFCASAVDAESVNARANAIDLIASSLVVLW